MAGQVAAYSLIQMRIEGIKAPPATRPGAGPKSFLLGPTTGLWLYKSPGPVFFRGGVYLNDEGGFWPGRFTGCLKSPSPLAAYRLSVLATQTPYFLKGCLSSGLPSERSLVFVLQTGPGSPELWAEVSAAKPWLPLRR